MAVIKDELNLMTMPLSMARTEAQPIDSTSVWYSLADAKSYAANNGAAYVGQVITVVDATAGTSVAYVIKNTAGDLEPIGASSIIVVTGFDVEGGIALADAVEGKFYVEVSAPEMRIKSGDQWVILSEQDTLEIVTTITDFENVDNNDKLATVGSIKEYITKTINDITGGTAFVKGLSWDEEAGDIKVDKGEAEPTLVSLSGVAKKPTWDAGAFTLTIPVIGGDPVVVNIPKDSFVTGGAYYESYTDAESVEHENVIVLTVENGDPVIIPATGLVDVYTANNEGKNITVTVTGTEISASLVVPAAEGDAATTGKLMVVDGATGEVVSYTDVSLLLDGDLGTDATKVPVASVIANAITTAIDNFTTTMEKALAKKMDALEEGAENMVVLTTETGVKRSEYSVGGQTLADAPNATTLATEKAVADAVAAAELSWQTF